jgi:hypothetical protein
VIGFLLIYDRDKSAVAVFVVVIAF